MTSRPECDGSIQVRQSAENVSLAGLAIAFIFISILRGALFAVGLLVYESVSARLIKRIPNL